MARTKRTRAEQQRVLAETEAPAPRPSTATVSRTASAEPAIVVSASMPLAASVVDDRVSATATIAVNGPEVAPVAVGSIFNPVSASESSSQPLYPAPSSPLSPFPKAHARHSSVVTDSTPDSDLDSVERSLLPTDDIVFPFGDLPPLFPGEELPVEELPVAEDPHPAPQRSSPKLSSHHSLAFDQELSRHASTSASANEPPSPRTSALAEEAHEPWPYTLGLDFGSTKSKLSLASTENGASRPTLLRIPYSG